VQHDDQRHRLRRIELLGRDQIVDAFPAARGEGLLGDLRRRGEASDAERDEKQPRGRDGGESSKNTSLRDLAERVRLGEAGYLMSIFEEPIVA
jgi:hypothetical protein